MAKAAAQTISTRELIYPAQQITITPEQYPNRQIYQNNLEALKVTNPKLADLISDAALPDNYTLDITSDGSFSFRISNPDNTSSWLGQRSAPLIAAQADLTRLDLGCSNAAMNGFGDGYTIVELLDRFMPYQAIFVLEKDMVNILANLSIHDLAEPIRSGQLVIIHSSNPFDALNEFLINNPGYQIIEKSLYVHRISEQENNQFNMQITATVENAVSSTVELSQQLNAKLKALEPHPFSTSSNDQLTISSLPCGNNPTDLIVTRNFLDGFNNFNVNTYFNSFSSPHKATTLAQTSDIIEQKPDAILLTNSLRNMANYPIPESLPIISILPNFSTDFAAELEENAIGPNDVIICPKNAIDKLPDKLKQQAIQLNPCVNQKVYKPLSLQQLQQYSNDLGSIPTPADVIMLTSRNSLDPEDYNVFLSTHQNLLSSALDNIADNPASYNSSLAQVYFDKAARKHSLKISDQETKERLQLIFQQLAESITQDIYGKSLIKENIPLSVLPLRQYLKNTIDTIDSLPDEWEHSPLNSHLTAMVTDSHQLNTILNYAKIALFTHNDGILTQPMLNAAAAGLLVMTKAHPKDTRSDGIKAVLTPGSEIITYSSPQDMCRKVRLYLDNEQKRNEITLNAVNKLNSEFSTSTICQTILSKLQQ